MAESGAINALSAVCQQVAERMPLAEVATAKRQAQAALAQLTAAGSSTNPRFLAAVALLTALLVDLDAVAADLATAADHVRTFGSRLQ